jgi:hypothetical protein
MNDQNKKPAIGGFSDMMEISEKKFAQKEKGGDELKKNESSLEQKKEITKERTLRHHSFDVFIDQLISLDQIRTRIFQEKGKKPKISTLVQEAFDEYIKNHKKERTND